MLILKGNNDWYHTGLDSICGNLCTIKHSASKGIFARINPSSIRAPSCSAPQSDLGEAAQAGGKCQFWLTPSVEVEQAGRNDPSYRGDKTVIKPVSRAFSGALTQR